MFKPRRIETSSDWLDADGIKLYTVSASGETVVQSAYLAQLQSVKPQKAMDWSTMFAFLLTWLPTTLLKVSRSSPCLSLASIKVQEFRRSSKKSSEHGSESGSIVGITFAPISLSMLSRNKGQVRIPRGI